jgi:hypothetical protein
MSSNFTVTVSGGDAEENSQLSNMIQSCLVEKGFYNVGTVSSDCDDFPSGVNLYDAVLARNPELLSASITIVGESGVSVFDRESAVIASMSGQRNSPFQSAYSHLN